VTDGPVELPVIAMEQASGLLMLQSEPTGATIMIDDRRWPVVTPARITLPPGRYRVTVEKGDLKAVQTVEIRDGDFRHLSVPLTPQ
jgi:PEGA domain-containing protein